MSYQLEGLTTRGKLSNAHFHSLLSFITSYTFIQPCLLLVPLPVVKFALNQPISLTDTGQQDSYKHTVIAYQDFSSTYMGSICAWGWKDINKFLFTKLFLSEVWLTTENTSRRAQVLVKYFGCTVENTVQKDSVMYQQELCLQSRWKVCEEKGSSYLAKKTYAPRKTADESWHTEVLVTILTTVTCFLVDVPICFLALYLCINYIKVRHGEHVRWGCLYCSCLKLWEEFHCKWCLHISRCQQSHLCTFPHHPNKHPTGTPLATLRCSYDHRCNITFLENICHTQP